MVKGTFKSRLTTLGVMMADKQVSPWVKRNEAASTGAKHKGLLYEPAELTREVLQEAMTHKLLTTDAAGNHVADRVYARQLTNEEDGTTTRFDGQVSLPKRGSDNIAVWLSIDDDESFYLIDTNGTPINQDTMQPLDETLDELTLACIRDILQRTVWSLRTGIAGRVYQQRERRERIMRRWMIAGIWLASLAVAGGGISFGVYKWSIEPAREAAAYAKAYDAAQHNLPGEGVPVVTHSFEKVSPEEFDAIPELSRKDKTLEHPRRTKLDRTYGCKKISAELPGDMRLRVAVADGTNAYQANGFNLAKNGSSIEICLANYKQNSSNYSIPIAVQAVNSQQ